jgi:hypothetical protein
MGEIVLGSKVRDRITGFEGEVTARTTYLYGLDRLCVEPRVTSEGKGLEGQWFEAERLEQLP